MSACTCSHGKGAHELSSAPACVLCDCPRYRPPPPPSDQKGHREVCRVCGEERVGLTKVRRRFRRHHERLHAGTATPPAPKAPRRTR